MPAAIKPGCVVQVAAEADVAAEVRSLKDAADTPERKVYASNQISMCGAGSGGG